MQCALNIDQRAIAFDQHQRRVNVARGQGTLHRIDQGFDVRNHARIEGSRERPARRAQAGGQLMAAGHRRVAVCLHPGAHLVFMRRVAHCKSGRNRKRRYASRMFGDRGAAGGFVQRTQGQACGIMPTYQAFYRINA